MKKKVKIKILSSFADFVKKIEKMALDSYYFYKIRNC